MPVLMKAQSAKRYIGFNKFLESVEVDVLFQKNCNSIAKALDNQPVKLFNLTTLVVKLSYFWGPFY